MSRIYFVLGPCQDYEKLAIFGDIRGRRGAELKVLSAIETKTPGVGYFRPESQRSRVSVSCRLGGREP